MSDKVFAEGIRVSHKVTKGAGSVGSGLFFRVFQELNKEWHARPEVLIQYIVVEPSVTHCEASKLPGVPIWILAAIDSGRNQPKLQQLLIEEPSVSTEIANQVAHLSPDPRILIKNQQLQIIVNSSTMNVLIEVLGNTSQL